jgi:hypothetical protein
MPPDDTLERARMTSDGAPYQVAGVVPSRGYEGRAVELVRPAQTEEKKGL